LDHCVSVAKAKPGSELEHLVDRAVERQFSAVCACGLECSVGANCRGVTAAGALPAREGCASGLILDCAPEAAGDARFIALGRDVSEDRKGIDLADAVADRRRDPERA
jgi:hypothetical protein